MKKPNLFSISTILLSVMIPAGISFAASTAGVPTTNVLSGEPISQSTGGAGIKTLTTTVPGKNSTGSGSRTGGQTGNSTTGTGSGGTNLTAGGNSKETTPFATDIPLVPSVTEQTVVPSTTSNGSDQSSLVCNQDRCQQAIAQANSNQIIVMTILMLGALCGGMLWILALMMMKKGVIEREERNMNRQNQHHFKQMLLTEKTKAYNGYIDAVINVVEKLQNKKAINPEEMRKLNEGSTFIKLNGSKPLRSMNEDIEALVSKGKAISPAEQIRLKTDLAKTIKMDLNRN